MKVDKSYTFKMSNIYARQSPSLLKFYKFLVVTYALSCYICVLPVCLCYASPNILTEEVLRKFQYLNLEKAKKTSVLGEKSFVIKPVYFF